MRACTLHGINLSIPDTVPSILICTLYLKGFSIAILGGALLNGESLCVCYVHAFSLSSPDKLSKMAVTKKWCYIKLQCLQPYASNRQYGLRLIKLYSRPPGEDTPSGSLSDLTSSPSTPRGSGLLAIPPRSAYSTPQRKHLLSPETVMSVGRRLPTLRTMEITRPGTEENTSTITTPKRTRRHKEEEEEEETDEFTGLEGQSRLLRRALNGDQSIITGNSIIRRVAAERGKKATEGPAMDDKKENKPCYPRRKLLVKELPKAASGQSVDFLSTYNKEDIKKASATAALTMRRLARFGE